MTSEDQLVGKRIEDVLETSSLNQTFGFIGVRCLLLKNGILPSKCVDMF